MKIKIGGFKIKRLFEFWRAARSEGKSVWEIVVLVTGSIQDLGVDRSLWRQRMRICMKCPIYDYTTKKCRMMSLGCGCYTPFKTLLFTKGCYAKHVKIPSRFGKLGWW